MLKRHTRPGKQDPLSRLPTDLGAFTASFLATNGRALFYPPKPQPRVVVGETKEREIKDHKFEVF